MSLTIEEYRKMLNDQASTDEQIKARLLYLEALCRNIIQGELQTVRAERTVNY